MQSEAAFERGAKAFTERRIEAALHEFNQAESAGHSRCECAAYRWQCWMLLGKFEKAWLESDFISAMAEPDPYALWDGEEFAHKRVVIRCLHGYGDAIQFLRYAPYIRKSAARLIVQTHPEMVSLVRLIDSIDQVITWSTIFPRECWDQQIEVTELPRAFRTTIDNIPAHVPYIFPEKNSQMNRRKLAGTARPKVGLLWASSLWNPARSMRLLELLPIIRLPIIRKDTFDFYSFQRGPERAQLGDSSLFGGIHDTAIDSPSIADTAADLMHLDLLITVDTMAAHLAGALGRPVWTLLPYEADWRWMLHRADTPWYPTMRLFRQKSPGDWGSVVDSVAEELARWSDYQYGTAGIRGRQNNLSNQSL
jgi:hypothetical protein